MSNLSKLEGIKRQAQKEGWAKFIRTEADEKALLKGFSFSFEHWDHFRFFCESFLVFNKGKWKGKGFEFLPYQEIICGSLFGWISTSDGYRRFKRAFIELPKKNGKALALDTDIPTPSGFKKIKDISVGDLVFGDDGKPTRVIAESPIFYGHDCFKLVFGNGQEVVADADHLWEIFSILPQRVIDTRTLFDARKSLQIEIRTLEGREELESIEPVESVPTKCLAVDNESHLFLITKSFLVTHNTTLSAAIGLYMFAGDGEAGAEVYNIANDRDQAALLWNVAADYVEANDYLKKLVTVTRSTRRMNINGKETFTAWSSDQTSKDGPNIHCAIIDELHEWQGAAAREMWRKIRYGAVARAQPLCPLVITTAGSDRQTLCYEQHQYAERILEGTAEDLSFFAMIFGADPKKIKADPDYWKSEEAFKEANPAYEIILKKEDFESDVIEVENDPVAKYGFFRYRLGIWTEGATPWIERTVWEACSEPYFIEEDLRGWPCFTGMDLSSVNDFTSVVHVFPYFCQESGVKKFRILPRFYCPEESFSKRVRNNDASLGIWHERGLIRLTPGSAIEHEEIFKDIEKDSKTFDIRQIGYDRYSAAWIIQQIQKILPEIELYPVSQAITTISEPTKAFFTAITQGRIEHAGNPVLSWQVANAVPEENSNGDIKLSKSRSRDKIDGVIAAIMAFNQAQLGELEVKKKFSVYGNPEFKAMIKKIEGVAL